MSLQVEKTALAGVLLLEPDVFEDSRGFFMETYNWKRYKEVGIDRVFVQDNYSHSCARTLRGLHYQLYHTQAKLVSVVAGEIFDVAVDIRAGSPTFGQWVGQVLSAKNRCQLFIPEGFAHGFCVLSETADVMYKCTDFYVAEDDRGILWCDPDLKIKWPVSDPIISAKDQKHPRLAEVGPGQLPRYEV